MEPRVLPPTLQLNAWTGAETAHGALSAELDAWMLASKPAQADASMVPRVANLRDLREAGWGVILPYLAGKPDAQQARADDAPEPIQQLLRDRDGVVLRYKHDSSLPLATLYVPAIGKPLVISEYGEYGDYRADRPLLPTYLLIYASPDEIPWRLQFALNSVMDRYVGRLELAGEALENYVSALRQDWNEAKLRSRAPLIWSVDHGEHDITRLMRNSIGERLYTQYTADADLRPGARFLDGQNGKAGAGDLIGALRKRRPDLIVTTSHGMIGPLDDQERMGQQLGWLVDQEHQPIAPEQLLDRWEPNGAIWYAHACCSAGSMGPSAFRGLLSASSSANQVLEGAASLGNRVAPLPRALLGARRPLRAFIGHVEPTFDYTLQQAGTNQFLTGDIIKMLNEYAYDPARYPVGMMAQQLYKRLGYLALQADNERERGEAGGALYYQLCFRDVQSMVILGDPAVALPVPNA